MSRTADVKPHGRLAMSHTMRLQKLCAAAVAWMHEELWRSN
eukprot:CAMPEP_0115313070 /NCGR_PEP_ID=MMETSP0270-20121206/76265_1 /TAXON_ID=71861 /ORGANISM="Scrippsiella trochoidea, Strain CCMP3099" /LENGTH=40 /DNA_ID= /DNA_START= /DNA_END= /DNA_ORIENTATION=